MRYIRARGGDCFSVWLHGYAHEVKDYGPKDKTFKIKLWCIHAEKER